MSNQPTHIVIPWDRWLEIGEAMEGLKNVARVVNEYSSGDEASKALDNASEVLIDAGSCIRMEDPGLPNSMYVSEPSGYTKV